MSRRLAARRHQSGLMLLCIVMAGVSPRSAEPQVNRDAAKAESFIVALNARNLDALVADSSDPFLFREQEWVSARDGSGFVLGRAIDRSVSGARKRKFLADLASRVRAEGTSVAPKPPSRETFLTNQLKGAPTSWSRLELFVFTRGFGDVEHIAIVAVDHKTHKVKVFILIESWRSAAWQIRIRLCSKGRL